MSDTRNEQPRAGRLASILVLCVAVWTAPIAAAAQPASDLSSIDSLIAAGKYAEAEKSARAELARAEASAGRDSAAVAHVINRLADVLLRQGRTDEETAALIARAASIEQQTEPGSRELASALRNQGWLFEARGDNEKANPLYARALETLKAAAGDTDPATLLMQKDLAMSHASLGDFAKARTLLEEALKIRSAQDPQHLDVAVLRHNLGSVYWEQGDYIAARDAFIAASTGIARALGDEHPHVATSLEGLAVVQVALGQYADARSNYRRVLAIREKALPAGHPLIGQTLVNLGDVLMSIGDLPAAKDSLERGLAIWEKSLGPDHPMLVVALTNLAVARERTGDRAGARRAFERAIAVREKANGPEDPDLVIPLTQLANLLADDGQLAAARPLYARARAIGERRRGADHPYVASAALDEGLRLAAAGDLTGAGELIDRALRIRERAFGMEHPDTAAALDASARIAAARGRTREAIDTALRAEAIARRHFEAAASVLPEHDALLYAEGRAHSQDLAIALALRDGGDDPDLVTRLWDTVIRSRALVLDEMSWRLGAAASRSPEVKRDFDEVAASRARLAQLFIRGPVAAHPAEYARELSAARQAGDRAEERLARDSTAFRHQREQHEAGFDQVRGARPAGAAIVSFVRYDTPVFNRPGQAVAGAYAAFVLPPDEARPVLVPIGPAGPIETAIARWRREARAESAAPPMGAARREQRYREAGAALRRRVFDPIAARVSGASLLLIVPDAALHLVDFASLPVGSRQYLVETAPTLHYATAERDFIPERVSPGKGLLAIGAPAFDRAPAPSRAVTAHLRSACVSRPGVRFAALPESAREVDVVARLWRDDSGDALVLQGVDASEASLKVSAPGHRVLHLATHAFVMGEGCGAALESNPLLGAGLVLAGASRRGARATAEGDGILTAEEISTLDLTGVEWAVLSACDSGTGIARAGEGVFGLRRAFQIAGVRTVIMSLWPVEDRFARRWMEALYTARLERGRSTADAVRDASRQALADRRRAGGGTHPFYWSGFVAAGDWR